MIINWLMIKKVYVDDMLLMFYDGDEIRKFGTRLGNTFKICDLGKPSRFLGMEKNRHW